MRLAALLLVSVAAWAQYYPPAGGGSGTGDVVGPAGATSLNLAQFQGATGKVISDSGLAKTLSVGTPGLDTNIPTEKAVRTAIAAGGGAGTGSCTNQAVTAVNSGSAPTCTTLTSAYVNNTIALTGTDINTSNQVTATHLASALPAAQGGTGVGNTATLTLGSSNQNWATLGTGIVKNTTTTGALSNAASSDVLSLWTGTCNSSSFLRGDGACAAPSGSGNTTSTSLTTNKLPKANGANSIIDSSLSDDGTTVSTTEALSVGSVAVGTSPPSVTAGTGGVWASAEGTAPSVCAAASVGCLYNDSTQHGLLMSRNNGSYLPIPQGPASTTSGHVASWNSTNGGLLADGGAVAANIVVASSPGAGIAHFAGSTQTVTSSAVDLSGADVTGNLGVSHLNSGTSASSSTYWRGDGTWATPSGSGNTTSTSLTTNKLPKANGANSIIDSSISDDGTTVSTTEALALGTSPPTCTNGTGAVACLKEGTAPTTEAAADILYADSTAHRLKVMFNGAAATTPAVFTDKLSVFAATSSSELAGVISDETGSGVLAFATSPAFTTDIHCASAGGCTLGTAALPASSVYIGGAATNNIRLTGTSAAARVATIPDVAADSTVVLAATSTTTTQVLHASATAGLGVYSALAAADMPAADLSTGTTKTFSLNNGYFECTGTCTITMPVPSAGRQYCVRNANNVTTVITFAAIGSSAMYENTANTAYGTAGTGTLVSGGAAGDKMCLVGKDSTHYDVFSFNGTWTAN